MRLNWSFFFFLMHKGPEVIGSYMFFYHNPKEMYVTKKRNGILNCNPGFFLFFFGGVGGCKDNLQEELSYILTSAPWEHPGLDGTGWPLDVPLCCLYRFSHREICGGWTESCGLSFFLFFFIFSQTFNLADPLYLLTRQPSTCRLPRLQKKKSMALAKLKCVFLLRGVVLMVNILDIVTDSLRQLELPSRAWRLKSDTNNSFPLRRSELLLWTDTHLFLVHTNSCLFIPILRGWCVLMDVCRVIGFSLK